MMYATYSPDDNKLRLYTTARLDPDTYARVKGAGFKWAPKQDLFVAPMWTPDRADLLIDLCGEIEDEDKSLVERAEERSERFEGYSDNRAEDAERARQAVSAIADNIPLGQPILVGHHSERHARRDAEKIENGMRRAIRLWETSQYWTQRAAGALRHAKYKERPDVRARRIKGIEADKRKQTKIVDESRALIALWEKPLETPMKDGSINPRARVIAIANMDRGYWSHAHEYRRRDEAGRQVGEVYHTGPLSLWEAAGGNIHSYDPEACAIATPEEVRDKAISRHHARIAWAERWIAHYDFRLEYERAMLAESGGLITDQTEYPIVPGGRVLVRGEWLTVTRVNRTEGRITSVSTNSRYVRVKGIEEVKEYQPPTEASAKAARAVSKQPPIINEDTPGARHMTKAEFDDRRKHSDCWYYQRVNAAGEYAAYRQAMGWRGGEQFAIFFTDQKVKPRPLADETIERPTLPAPERVIPQRSTPTPETPSGDAFEAMRATLAAGVQVVAAPQLFPTPPDVARQVIELAEIEAGDSVLEPNAGTGALVTAVQDAEPTAKIFAVEINHQLAERLSQMLTPPGESVCTNVLQADFLECNGNLGKFDRVVMNPPFKNAEDIKHILHARRMLKPDGRLVAVCANGPRQREALQPIAEHWVDLPAGSFEASGTGVNAAIVVLSAE